jgi:hypothetical protein
VSGHQRALLGAVRLCRTEYGEEIVCQDREDVRITIVTSSKELVHYDGTAAVLEIAVMPTYEQNAKMCT